MIKSMKQENQQNLEKLRRLADKNKKKTYYGQHKAVFVHPNQKKKKKAQGGKFKKRMTLFQIKRKKSLSKIKEDLETQQGLTFRPKINEVSRRLVEHIRPFHQRWVSRA